MSRLIDADELKKCIKNECRREWEISHRFCMDFDDVIDCIDDQPTVDTEPMVHAHWIELDDSVKSCKCSHCGFVYNKYEDDIYGYQYCANCGAVMRREGK